MVLMIESPKTGRMIRVSGKAYKDLLLEKRYAAKARNAPRVNRPAPGKKTSHAGRKTKAKSVSLPKAKPQSLRATYSSSPPTRRAKLATLSREMSHSGERRGERTRGWGAAAPQRGTERRQLKQRCGDECFLMPGRESFPICAALRTKEGCKVDCRGITSARVRAAQWGYPEVERQAMLLEKKYRCK